MSATSLDELREVFHALTDRHGWAPLQTPRNLTLALTGRVGAVASLLQWAPDEEQALEPDLAALRAELADCLVYLVALGDRLGFDVLEEAVARIGAAFDPTPQDVTG